MVCVARKTSVYLSDADEAALAASGLTLPEVIRRGLDLTGRQQRTGRAPAPQAVFRDAADCPHRGLSPGSYCKTCGSTVPEKAKKR